MSLFNRSHPYEEIAKRIFTVVTEIKKGKLCEEYLDVELYGLLEKNENNWIRIRVSEKAYELIKDKISTKDDFYPNKKNNSEKYIPNSAKKGTHAEHVCPRAFLKKEFRKLINDENLSVEKIKDIISKNCRGVLITKNEAKLLDCKKYGLKQNMPPGWEFGRNDVDERFTYFNNKVEDDMKIKIHQIERNGKMEDEYFIVSDF